MGVEVLVDVVNTLVHTILYQRELGTVSVGFRTCPSLPSTSYVKFKKGGVQNFDFILKTNKW